MCTPRIPLNKNISMQTEVKIHATRSPRDCLVSGWKTRADRLPSITRKRNPVATKDKVAWNCSGLSLARKNRSLKAMNKWDSKKIPTLLHYEAQNHISKEKYIYFFFYKKSIATPFKDYLERSWKAREWTPLSSAPPCAAQAIQGKPQPDPVLARTRPSQKSNKCFH